MKTEKARPDILVFFCDQLRLDLLGCYGGNLVRTPNIDALAADSVTFDSACTPCAICSPARASLMTGLYPHAHHMFNNSSPGYSYCQHLRPDVRTLAGRARENGRYETAYFGKWHIGPAGDLFKSPFHRTHPRPGEADLPYLDSSHWHPNPGHGAMVRSFAGGKAGTLDIPVESFPDGAAARFSRDFMRARAGEADPFLLFCAFPGPHSPWLVPEEFGIRHDPASIPMWGNRRDSMSGKPVAQKNIRLMQRQRCNDPDDDTLRELLACNFSYLELIDSLVGEVVGDLRKSGRYEDTAIIFTADHGDMAGAHGILSKGACMYDEIYRIPLIFKAPGPAAGRRVPAPVNLMDVTATILHLMEGDPVTAMGGRDLHGNSLLTLLEDPGAPWRDLHYAGYHGDWYGHYSSRMVRDGRWKLAWNFSDYSELYDLENDPGEMRNLFYEPAHARTRDEYSEKLVSEARRLGDGQALKLSPAVARDRRVFDFEAGLEGPAGE